MYNPQFNPYQPYQPYQYPTIQRKVDLVQGKSAADVYPVNAGEDVILIDMDNPYVYHKSRGFDNKLEPMQMFDLIPHEEKVEKVQQVNLDGYVKFDQVEQMIRDEVEKRMSDITLKPTPKRKREEDE